MVVHVIVKIQCSQPPSLSGQIFVYTRNFSKWWIGAMNPAVASWMGEDQKVFAHAHMEGGWIVIDRKAPWKEW